MRKNGFTLIELMITVTIGILIVGFGSIALNDFNEKQKVEAVKQELLADLRLARNYAVTNQLPNGGNRTVVTVDNDGLIIIKAQDVNNNDIGASFFQKDLTPKGISISFDRSVGFSVTDGRSINGVVNIGISGNDLIKTIKIDESGLIYEE